MKLIDGGNDTVTASWLCPALFCSFLAAPEKIAVRADRLPAGVNPILKPPDDAKPRRVVEAP